jgi:uncharacterized protein
MSLLIDGFNLIYKFPELEGLMYRNRLQEARKGLLEKLKKYQELTRYKIRVVFDGKKDKSLDMKSEKLSGIDVFYSLDFSADFLIKEFIRKDLNPRMTIVVTSDKGILDFVTRFKAKTKTSDEFVKHINRIFIKTEEAVELDKEDDPLISDEEINYWEKQFSG